MPTGDTLQIDETGHQAFLAPTGGEQTISLIGPYPIDYTMTALTDYAVELGDELAVGTVVIRAWAIVGDRWVATPIFGANDLKLDIGIGNVAEGTLSVAVDGSLSEREQSYPSRILVESGTPGVVSTTVAQAVVPGQFLTVGLTNYPGATMTAGTADIYALIATPS
jgi:hypothetical protein